MAACTITQADLGPKFADAPADLVTYYIAAAMLEVLGPEACQLETAGKMRACCIDPCYAVRLLAQHMIASDSSSGVKGKTVVSKRVGDVSASYANTTSSTGPHGDTPWGVSFDQLMARYNRCRAGRRLPMAVWPVGGCG